MKQNYCENYNLSQKTLARTRQMRTETVTGYPYLRNAPIPQHQNNFPCLKVNKLSEIQIQQYNNQIFEIAMNYLRLLVVRGVYLVGQIEDQIIVFIEENTNKLLSTQLMAVFLTRTPQPLQQLVDFAAFLKVNVQFNFKTQKQFFFHKKSNCMICQQNIEDLVANIDEFEQIDLLNNQNKILISYGRILDNNALLKSIVLHAQDQQFYQTWVVLARFINALQAIRQFENIPPWINEYVKYENPLQLPDEFLTMCNFENELENLRIMLGIYPSQMQYHFGDQQMVELPVQFKNVASTLPIWYQVKFNQLYFAAESLDIGLQVKDNGINLECPATEDGIKELCDMYQ